MPVKEIGQLENGQTYDRQTGEIIKNGFYVWVPNKLKVKEGFFMGFLKGFRKIAEDRDLRGVTRSVLDYLMSILEFENYIVISQIKIATDLKIGKDQVSKGIRILLKKDIIIKGQKSGCSWTYRLNEEYAWRGKIKNMEKHKKNSK